MNDDWVDLSDDELRVRLERAIDRRWVDVWTPVEELVRCRDDEAAAAVIRELLDPLA